MSNDNKRAWAMWLYGSLPLAGLPERVLGLDLASMKLIIAVLIMEHGLSVDKKRQRATIKSKLFYEGAFGNVVVRTQKRSKNIKPGIIDIKERHELDTDTLKTLEKLETKYGIRSVGIATWTGRANDALVWHYIRYHNIEDYFKYMVARLKLPHSLENPTRLKQLLQSYSGHAPQYANKVFILMNKLKYVNL